MKHVHSRAAELAVNHHIHAGVEAQHLTQGRQTRVAIVEVVKYTGANDEIERLTQLLNLLDP